MVSDQKGSETMAESNFKKSETNDFGNLFGNNQIKSNQKGTETTSASILDPSMRSAPRLSRTRTQFEP